MRAFLALDCRLRSLLGVEKSFLFTFDLPPERSVARLRHCRIFPGVNKTNHEALITDVLVGF